MTPFRISHLFLLLLAVAIWGLNFVVIKVALTASPPIFLCFARFLFSALPAIFFIKRPPIPFKVLCLYSFVMFVVQFSLLFGAMHLGITAALASILIQLQSFFAILFAVVFMGEKFHRMQAAGFAMAFLGLALVAMQVGGDLTFLGLFLIVSAAVMWAAGSAIVKKLSLRGGLSLVVWGSLIACPPLFLASYFIEGPALIIETIQGLDWVSFLSILYIAYFATVFAFGTWNRLLSYYPLSRLAPFTLLVPIVGSISSALLLGEPLQWWKIAAAILILSGLALHLSAGKAATRPTIT